MSKKRDPLDDAGFSLPFKGMRSFICLLDEMLESGVAEVKRSREVKDFGGIKGAHLAYNYSVKTIANNKSESKKPIDSHESVMVEKREPLVDILNGEDHLTVIAELPHVKEDHIKLNLVGNRLIISTDAPRQKYHNEIPLPAPVKTGVIKTKYKNGILEVKLEKA